MTATLPRWPRSLVPRVSPPPPKRSFRMSELGTGVCILSLFLASCQQLGSPSASADQIRSSMYVWTSRALVSRLTHPLISFFSIWLPSRPQLSARLFQETACDPCPFSNGYKKVRPWYRCIYMCVDLRVVESIRLEPISSSLGLSWTKHSKAWLDECLPLESRFTPPYSKTPAPLQHQQPFFLKQAESSCRIPLVSVHRCSIALFWPSGPICLVSEW